jgi:hypothetical protein
MQTPILNRRVEPQADGTFRIFCADCGEFVASALNERAILFAAGGSHQCPENKTLSH